MNDNPMRLCPRFEDCSVPVCLLGHSQSGIRLPGEPKCTLGKGTRMKYGKDLPWRGLNPAELAHLKKWEELSSEEQNKRRLAIRSAGQQSRGGGRSGNEKI